MDPSVMVVLHTRLRAAAQSCLTGITGQCHRAGGPSSSQVNTYRAASRLKVGERPSTSAIARCGARPLSLICHAGLVAMLANSIDSGRMRSAQF